MPVPVPLLGCMRHLKNLAQLHSIGIQECSLDECNLRFSLHHCATSVVFSRLSSKRKGQFRKCFSLVFQSSVSVLLNMGFCRQSYPTPQHMAIFTVQRSWGYPSTCSSPCLGAQPRWSISAVLLRIAISQLMQCGSIHQIVCTLSWTPATHSNS